MKVIVVGLVWVSAITAAFSSWPGFASQATATATPTPFLPDFSTAEIAREDTLILDESWPAEMHRVAEYIINAAQDQDKINPQLAIGLIASITMQESGSPLNCPDGPITSSCLGSDGEIGPMQVLPTNFEWNENPWDLRTNFVAGTRVLTDYAFVITGGDIFNSLRAYNRGTRYDQYPESETYAMDVLRIFEEYVGYPYPGTN